MHYDEQTSITGLIKGLLDDARDLIREEVQLARAELRDPVARRRVRPQLLCARAHARDPRDSPYDRHDEGEPGVDAKKVRVEIRRTRASIDRKLDLLSSRTSQLAEQAKDAAWTTAAATMMAVGVTIVLSWWKRHA